MADFLQHKNTFKINIPSWKNVDNATFYVLKIEIGTVKWAVDRRYSEFDKLHQSLVSSHGVIVDILPPKKVIGNKEEQFIEKRRVALEHYIRTVVRFLQETVPKALATFLNLDKYDIHFIVKSLAIKIFQIGDRILSVGKQYTFTMLELYAINERLKQPCSNLDLVDQREDFSHILDFCCQLQDVIIVGNENVVGDSNIHPNKLAVQLSIFKALTILTLKNININCINDFGTIRNTLKVLNIDSCWIASLIDALLCDQMHKIVGNKLFEWVSLTKLSITNTVIGKLDDSVQLLPNIQNIQLQNNKMVDIDHLKYLQKLNHLTISRNLLSFIHDFEVCNLSFLDLSENQITSLKPFSKLCCLVTINLQINKIQDVEEVQHISDIQSLENIILTGNPVSRIVDYRVKVLAHFGPRAFRICLDNESTHQKELDKASILRALNKDKFSHLTPQVRHGSVVNPCTQQADEVT